MWADGNAVMLSWVSTGTFEEQGSVFSEENVDLNIYGVKWVQMALFFSVPNRVNATESNQTAQAWCCKHALYYIHLLNIMTSNSFIVKWAINCFCLGPISSWKPIVIPRWYSSHLKDALTIYTRSVLGSYTHISNTYDISFDSRLYGLGFSCMWSVFRVSLCQKSFSLFRCLSLLLSCYPLTHILVITSGVPCRNSITPPPPSSSDIKLSPCPWTQDQPFIFSCSLILTEGDRKVSFPLLRSSEGSLLPLHAIWSQLPVHLILSNWPAGPPRACLMLPEALMQVYFTGAGGQ